MFFIRLLAKDQMCERYIFRTVSNCPLESSFAIMSSYFFISFKILLN